MRSRLTAAPRRLVEEGRRYLMMSPEREVASPRRGRCVAGRRAREPDHLAEEAGATSWPYAARREAASSRSDPTPARRPESLVLVGGVFVAGRAAAVAPFRAGRGWPRVQPR